jgi:1-acyl-sn-glycerol-3-phosphate acyltransferase
MKIKMKSTLYSIAYYPLAFVLRLIFWLDIKGRENIPEGGAVFCARHAKYLDPVLMAISVGYKNQLHFMAKKELFDKPFLGGLLRALGMFSVDRSKVDITSIKTAMAYLKAGKKIGIYPEGKRISQDDSSAAKSGAVKLADKAGVPIVPVFMPRTHKPFRKMPVIIGEPYYVNPDGKRLTAAEYKTAAEELMEHIYSLKPEGLKE